MVIFRRKNFSKNHSDQSLLGGVDYYSAQVGGDIGENILDPLGEQLEKLERSLPISEKSRAKRNLKTLRKISETSAEMLKRNKQKISGKELKFTKNSPKIKRN